MSRFLKKRHYRLVLPGILLLEIQNPKENLEQLIYRYMDSTGVSYTVQDVAEIQTMFLNKHGHKS